MDWYCLIHQIPPKPLYLRAKIRQRLASVGAIALKKSVYILPHTDDCLEDFQWLAQEIESGGGTAFICAMSFVDQAQQRDAIEQFRAERAADYEAVAGEMKEMQRRRPPADERASRMARLRRRLEEIQAIDFFPDRKEKEVLAMFAKTEAPKRERSAKKNKALLGKTWVTRRGVKVDRIATAWLIRRFIDPDARIRLVDPAAFEKRSGELTFDMAKGDYTHVGDQCTFETLLRSIDATPPLKKIAEIVHDIDLKDGKYGRPETAGVQRLLTGILESTTDDDERFLRGFEMFDQLHESFRKGR
jgi:hypothetical protein